MAITRSTCARSFISGLVKATVWRRGTGKVMVYDERPVPWSLRITRNRNWWKPCLCLICSKANSTMAVTCAPLT
jgi:hypothetical protein